jgi:hypothetical protein
MTYNRIKIFFTIIFEIFILLYFSEVSYNENIYRSILTVTLLFSIPNYIYIKKEIENLKISIVLTLIIFIILSMIFIPIAINEQNLRETKINLLYEEIEDLLDKGKANDALVYIKEFKKRNPFTEERIYKLTKRIELVAEKDKCLENIYRRINKPYNGETLLNLLNDLIKTEKDLEIFPSMQLKTVFFEIKEYLIKEIKSELSKSMNSQVVESEYTDSIARSSLSYIREDIKLLKHLDAENPNLKIFDSKFNLKERTYGRILENNSFACIHSRYKQGCSVWCTESLGRECQEPLQAFFRGLKCSHSTITEIMRDTCKNL